MKPKIIVIFLFLIPIVEFITYISYRYLSGSDFATSVFLFAWRL